MSHQEFYLLTDRRLEWPCATPLYSSSAPSDVEYQKALPGKILWSTVAAFASSSRSVLSCLEKEGEVVSLPLLLALLGLLAEQTHLERLLKQLERPFQSQLFQSQLSAHLSTLEQ